MKTVLGLTVTVALFAAVYSLPSGLNPFKGFGEKLVPQLDGLMGAIKNPVDKIKEEATAAGADISAKISKQLDGFAEKAKDTAKEATESLELPTKEKVMAPLEKLQEFITQSPILIS